MDTHRALTAAGTSTRAASALTGIARASMERDAARATPLLPQRQRPANALTAEEKARVLAVLDGPEFVDAAPAQAYAALLDQGVYVGSISTMYRILREHRQVRDSGGWHLYFRASDADTGIRVTSGAGMTSGLGWGIDVRAHGGYVVAPPSVRPEGPYVGTGGNLRALPDWLLDALDDAGRCMQPVDTLAQAFRRLAVRDLAAVAAAPFNRQADWAARYTYTGELQASHE